MHWLYSNSSYMERFLDCHINFNGLPTGSSTISIELSVHELKLRSIDGWYHWIATSILVWFVSRNKKKKKKS